jgi:general secretion pathway protein F/type IV pilus assembly protein PilC
MAEFTYEAMTSSGQRNKGSLVAASEREVMSMLDARGLFPVRIAPMAASAGRVAAGGHKVRGRYVAGFFSQLADLLHSGVPLLRSLEILERQSSKPALSAVIREIHSKVADGGGLAEAMMQHPRVFNELSISMVRAGQEGGFLEDVLRRIADFMEHQEELKAKIVGAMAYPVFLALAGLLVLNILIIFFVPKFEPIFQKLDEKGELPVFTSVLVSISHAMQRLAIPTFLLGAYGLASLLVRKAMTNAANAEVRIPWLAHVVAIGLAGVAYNVVCPEKWRATVGEQSAFVFIVAGIFVFLWWARKDSSRYKLDVFRLKVPMVGGIYLSFALCRFTRILSTLLHNGIPILNSLRISKDSTGNRVLAEAVEHAAENITAGESLAAPLSECKYFPRDVVEMIAVGEESNNLEKVLMDISESTERRTSRQLEMLVRLLEPAMLLVMGVVVLFVVAGLLLPVFKMSSAVR